MSQFTKKKEEITMDDHYLNFINSEDINDIEIQNTLRKFKDYLIVKMGERDE